MSDLHDLDRESEQQNERAENLERDAQEHKERVDKLEQRFQEIEATMHRIDSDSGRLALQEIHHAKTETEHKLEQIRVERDQLLDENSRHTDEVRQSHQERKDQAVRINLMMFEAKDEVKGHLHAAHDALQQDLSNLTRVWAQFEEARQKLERLQL